MLMAAILTMSLVSCSSPENGESWERWELRNLLNGGWGLWSIMVNGEAKQMGDPELASTPEYYFYFDMNLRADGRKFEFRRFSYKNDIKDNATEIIKSGTFTLDSNTKTIVASEDNGNKVFTMIIKGDVSSFMDVTITFHDTGKTYDVTLQRSSFIDIIE